LGDLIFSNFSARVAMMGGSTDRQMRRQVKGRVVGEREEKRRMRREGEEVVVDLRSFFFCSGPPEKKNWEKVRRFLAGPIDKIHHLHNMLGIL
jgi:hypothetical protein